MIRNILHLQVSRTTPRAGFVLVMVLVLILLAALSVSGFARKSLEIASSVAEAQEALQRRWAVQSCRRVLLQNSEQILGATTTGSSSTTTPWPTPSFGEGSFMLGGMQFEFRLSDEDSKINLNTLAHLEENPLNRITSAIRLGGSQSGLRPMIRWPPRKASSKGKVPFRTWEQVFDLKEARETEELVDQLRIATGEITCWGSGKLNIRHASDEAVRIVCERGARDESIRKLLAQRRMGGDDELENLIGRIALKPQDAFTFRRLLSTESKCHSLWLTVRNTRRAWTSFSIAGAGTGNTASYESFVW